MMPRADSLAGRRIVVVEDDAAVARTIETVLRDFGFVTEWCRNGSDLLMRLRTLAPDLCIIDLGLPDMDGLELMQRLRTQSACGVMILTGRTHVSDRVMGLELGADDYVMKPFEPRELVARIRSVLRRRDESAGGGQRLVAEFAGWRFNLGNNTLTSADGEEQVLSTSEADILKVFVRHPNHILHREQLLGTRETAPNDRTIDVRISRLRKRLEVDERKPALIKTVYGAGYLFMATVKWLE